MSRLLGPRPPGRVLVRSLDRRHFETVQVQNQHERVQNLRRHDSPVRHANAAGRDVEKQILRR